MQVVKSRKYEVAECNFDDFSITIVLGRDDPDDEAGAAICCTAQPLLINEIEDIASRTCIESHFFIITHDIEQ